MAGYSGTPLPKKLGIKESCRLALAYPPDDIEEILGELPDGVEMCSTNSDSLDIIVFFTKEKKLLEDHFGNLARRLQPAGSLWIAWPKRSSRVETDLTENVVREVGLGEGLVDTKVCAISNIWSGLRFVYRLADRPALKGRRS
ncbi:MAG: DUF3052 domain-containing protein [Chloroflexi bacterium]|nr:DUF3052 domain-containing protein [Chloroflexota bacterium]MCY3937786.1 DUF3052 domain-containing protein [Chloroflexota bacterium]